MDVVGLYELLGSFAALTIVGGFFIIILSNV